MKIISVDNAAQAQLANLNSDEMVVVKVDCAGTGFAGATIIPGTITYETFVVCRRVDASNFCVQLPAPSPEFKVLEVCAEGGSITLFPVNGGGGASTFLDGTSSLVTTRGVRLRSVASPTLGVVWAILS
jgi:hypothetical protein